MEIYSDGGEMSKEVHHIFPGGKRYAALAPALRAILGGPVRRIGLDAGFTCPTRDGSLGTGGCLYCDAGGARASYAQPELPVHEQLRRGIERTRRRDPDARFIAYFQAFTNTYAPPAELRRVYEEGLSDPAVAALAIGTRPDCLSEEVLDVLAEFAPRTFLWVEMGLQSTRNDTLHRVRRGHTVEQFVDAAQRLRHRNLRYCAHVIFGLPGDRPEDMVRSADLLNELGAWGVKIHNLYIDREAPIAENWRRGDVPLLSRDEYIDLLIEFLSRLSPQILIHRLLGEAPRERLLAPEWSADKQAFLRELDRRMDEMDAFQGAKRPVS